MPEPNYQRMAQDMAATARPSVVPAPGFAQRFMYNLVDPPSTTDLVNMLARSTTGNLLFPMERTTRMQRYLAEQQQAAGINRAAKGDQVR